MVKNLMIKTFKELLLECTLDDFRDAVKKKVSIYTHIHAGIKVRCSSIC